MKLGFFVYRFAWIPLLAVAGFLFFLGHANADSASDTMNTINNAAAFTNPVIMGGSTPAPGTRVDLSPIYQVVEPFAQSMVNYLIGLVIAFLAAFFGYLGKRFLGIHETNINWAKVQMAASNAAGRMFGKLDDQSKGMAFTVNSPTVAAETNYVVAEMAKAIKNSGVDPDTADDRIAKLILGHLGKLQAGAGAVPPVVIKDTEEPAPAVVKTTKIKGV